MIEILLLCFVFFIMKSILVDSIPKDQTETRHAGYMLALCLTVFLGCFMNMAKNSMYTQNITVIEIQKNSKEVKNECR